LARRTIDSDREARFVGSLDGPVVVDAIATSDDEFARMESELRRHGRQIVEVRASILVTERADLDRLTSLVSPSLDIDAALAELVVTQRWNLFCLADDVYAITSSTPGRGTAGDREPRRPMTPLVSGGAHLDLPSRLTPEP